MSPTIASTITSLLSSTPTLAPTSTSAPTIEGLYAPPATASVAPGQCPIPVAIPDYMIQGLPITARYTFHDISVITTGACMVFTVLCMAFLIYKHLSNITKAHEQLHILRICAFLPLYAIGNFVSVAEPSSYVWLLGWLKVLEALALTWFYLLMHWLLVSREESNGAEEVADKVDLKEVFLGSLIVRATKEHRTIMERFGSYRRQWTFVFQSPIVMTICAIATCVTQSVNKYCMNSSSADFAHLPITIVQMVSIVIAVVGVLNAYMPLSDELKPHRAVSKFLAFKLLVGLQILQNIIYQILITLHPSPLVPTAYLSPVDIGIGIPMMIVNIEMVFFAIFYFYAYSALPYKSQPDRPRAMGPLRASLQIMNHRELMAGTLFMFTMKKEAVAATARIEAAQTYKPEPEDSSQWQFWRQSGGEQLPCRSPVQDIPTEARWKNSSESAWSVPIAFMDLWQEREDDEAHECGESLIGVAR